MAESASPNQSPGGEPGKLKKDLGLWDVYCIATGAMFSSGFFLLPGLAAADGGPATVAAYLIAGVLMVPAMFSMLELATALPRAGGAYYFLDRSLGPAVGTVTGIGTWLSLVFKSSFALLGMGAYLAIAPGLSGFFGPPGEDGAWTMKVVAIALTIVFVLLNALGAKESTRLQKVFVTMILGVLTLFIVQGFWHIFGRMPDAVWQDRYTPFLHEENGWSGLLSTIGLVFVSYAGLTSVASVSEEVRRPERNLPLAMILSLATATAVYVAGVFIMISVLDRETLHSDYAPVATAAMEFTEWLPGTTGLILVVLAAIAAFASTGNAGIFSASRFPFAMARDGLLPERAGRLAKSGLPVVGVAMTGAAIIVTIVALPTKDVAKLGSTFNLLVFLLVNLAVIVMRESRISSYDPGFRTPLYPWLPLAGVLISVWLIVEMGWLTSLLSAGTVLLGFAWYMYYARGRIDRTGAIHHVFERLGHRSNTELEAEFRQIIKEKGLRAKDPYDEVLRAAPWIDLEPKTTFDDAVRQLGERLSDRVDLDPSEINRRLHDFGEVGLVPFARGIALLHLRLEGLAHSHIALARSRDGLLVPARASDDTTQAGGHAFTVYGVFALASPYDKPGQHLRLLAELATRAENAHFIAVWRRLDDPEHLRELLLRDTGFLELFIGDDPLTRPLVSTRVGDLPLPRGVFAAAVRRSGGDLFKPTFNTMLRHGDAVILIGATEGIDKVAERFVTAEPEGDQ